METESSIDELQRQVLQHTLEEVSIRRDEDTTDCCVICLEGVSEACEAVPCQHRNFDYLCLVSWLEHSPKCPLCKTTIVKVRYGFDGPDAKAYTVPQPAPRPSQVQPRAPTRTFDRRGRCRRSNRTERPWGPNRMTDSTSSDIVRRREVYRRSQYSKHVGSNRVSRYQELTPQMFCSDTDLVSRARMWIRRELQVFSFLTIDETNTGIPGPESTDARNAAERRRANNAEFLLEYVIAILKSVDVMGSRGQAEDMLADFLGRDNTKLFLHELRAWLRSPFTKLEDWDRAVQYEQSGSRNGPSVESSDVSQATSSETQREAALGSSQHQAVPQRKGDFYRPSAAGPSRQRHRPPPRAEPYGGRSSGRDRR